MPDKKSAKKQYSEKTEESFQEEMIIGDKKFTKRMSLRYGFNPGCPAAFYVEEGTSGPNLASMEVLHEGTKGLGFINLEDADYSMRIVEKMKRVFPDKECVAVMKHVNPSGVGLAETVVEAYHKAWNCDALSAFGSVDCFSGRVDIDVAKYLAEPKRNIEVIIAPSYTPGALETLATRKSLRIIKIPNFSNPTIDNGLEYKRVRGGFLVQKRYDSRVVSADNVQVVSKRSPTEDELEACIFSWLVAGFCRSNTIVIGRKDRTVGIGAGQMSRIDAARLAIYNANNKSDGSKGCVMASDAYMPFPDVIELAAISGITAVIWPLGSNNDDKVIQAGNRYNMALLATRYDPNQPDKFERCFDHH
jgi:phosphoribosylaminoimidazolecarboxamide formyltransferase/IMP cyclohydrolase